jgi:hypothetical protein
MIDVTEEMLQAALKAQRSNEFDLESDSIPFVKRPDFYWMKVHPLIKFTNVEEAKQFAVRAQMRAALFAALEVIDYHAESMK